MSYGGKTNEKEIHKFKTIIIMVIKIYNNTILTPVKCGSRYLDKIWESERIKFNHFHSIK